MKKLIGIVSIFVLSLFASSVFSSEPQLEQPFEEESQATQEESQSALDKLAVWPFESVEKKSQEDTGGNIDKVTVDQSVDEDGQTHKLVDTEDPSVQSD